ncbi:MULTISPECIES: hypothetical protein [Streptomyces]|jgi:hypothetical protein|uniref:GP88 family protein n=1 Tax=Streptomyces sp. SID5476 TaxID=2690302 RepID=UPI001F1ACA9B|nr:MULTISPECIES: hypothetical protein [Streptomyces]
MLTQPATQAGRSTVGGLPPSTAKQPRRTLERARRNTVTGGSSRNRDSVPGTRSSGLSPAASAGRPTSGTEDELLDPARDRVADVFPDIPGIRAAGWHSQDSGDVLAVLGPAPVGMPSNRIPRFQRCMNGRTFREWQAEPDARQRVHRSETTEAPA